MRRGSSFGPARRSGPRRGAVHELSVYPRWPRSLSRTGSRRPRGAAELVVRSHAKTARPPPVFRSTAPDRVTDDPPAVARLYEGRVDREVRRTRHRFERRVERQPLHDAGKDGAHTRVDLGAEAGDLALGAPETPETPMARGRSSMRCRRLNRRLSPNASAAASPQDLSPLDHRRQRSTGRPSPRTPAFSADRRCSSSGETSPWQTRDRQIIGAGSLSQPRARSPLRGALRRAGRGLDTTPLAASISSAVSRTAAPTNVSATRSLSATVSPSVRRWPPARRACSYKTRWDANQFEPTPSATAGRSEGALPRMAAEQIPTARSEIKIKGALSA